MQIADTKENTKNYVITQKEIKDILCSHNAVSSALNELEKILPFNADICYNIIIDLIKNNNDISMKDDYKNNKTNNNDDDYKHIENIVSSLTNNEINDLKNRMEETDEKERRQSREIVMKWKNEFNQTQS